MSFFFQRAHFLCLLLTFFYTVQGLTLLQKPLYGTLKGTVIDFKMLLMGVNEAAAVHIWLSYLLLGLSLSD